MQCIRTEFKLLSSLEKVFFDLPENVKEHAEGQCFKNEIYSFQLAGNIIPTNMWLKEFDVSVEVNSWLKECIQVYKIDYVPSDFPCFAPDYDKQSYHTKNPGLVPDAMVKITDKFRVKSRLAFSLWFEVSENSKACGIHPIEITLRDDEGDAFVQKVFTLEIINAVLPKQELINTCRI